MGKVSGQYNVASHRGWESEWDLGSLVSGNVKKAIESCVFIILTSRDSWTSLSHAVCCT